MTALHQNLKMSPPPKQFIQSMVDGGLLSEAEARASLAAMPEPKPTDPNPLVAHLIQQQKLTEFQAGWILDGRVGELLLGNYVLVDHLGEGGMGSVYKARHRRMKRVVAIKVLPKKRDHSEEHLLRFQCEIEAISKLNHPNIVTAYDADEFPGGLFLAMEFVDGRNLGTIVEERGPLPVAEALEVLARYLSPRGHDGAFSQRSSSRITATGIG